MGGAAAVLILVGCTLLVANGEVGQAEAWVFTFVNSWPGWLYPAMAGLQFAGVLVVGPLAALIALALRRYRLAAAAVLATALKLGGERLVKALVERQRPGQTVETAILRGDVARRGPSFPSGHAVLVLALATMVSPYLSGRWKAIPWLIAGSVLMARVYLGAHNPLDVVGGAALGVAIGAGLNFALGVPARDDSEGEP